MRRAGLSCLLLALLQAATAQTATVTGNVRDLSTRWAEYYARVYRVPVDLVDAIIDEESGWNPYAVSKKGAVGLMQLMPQTPCVLAFEIVFGWTKTSVAAWLTWLG